VSWSLSCWCWRDCASLQVCVSHAPLSPPPCSSHAPASRCRGACSHLVQRPRHWDTPLTRARLSPQLSAGRRPGSRAPTRSAWPPPAAPRSCTWPTALQKFCLDSSSSLIASWVTPSEFKHHARIKKQMHELTQDSAANDYHSSDDESAKAHKLSKEAKADQAVRGTDLIRLGNEKASVDKRFLKAFRDILATLSKAEIDLLKSKYAPAYTKAVAAPIVGHRPGALAPHLAPSSRHADSCCSELFSRPCSGSHCRPLVLSGSSGGLLSL
jgi:hypothetical protein